jgi:integrase
MPAVCARLGIKKFTFYGIRHESAEITFLANGLNGAQIPMRHSSPVTTANYVRSAGLYADRELIQGLLLFLK